MATAVKGWANKAVIAVTESAANTLTFAKIEAGISIFEKIGWVIHRINFILSATAYAQFNSTGDYLRLALVTSNTMTSLSPDLQGTICYKRVNRIDLGTAATGLFYSEPSISEDFTALPGSGLLVPPSPLYVAAYGGGLAAATTTQFEIFYTTVQLKGDEYWELVESTRVLT